MAVSFDDIKPGAYYWITLVSGETLKTHCMWVRVKNENTIEGSASGFDGVEVERDRIVGIDTLRDGLMMKGESATFIDVDRLAQKLASLSVDLTMPSECGRCGGPHWFSKCPDNASNS